MAYLGNTPTQQGFIPAIDFFSGNGSTVAFTLSRPVASVAQVQATIENVPQNPGTAFTVSGNTITFDGAPASGTNNIYVYYTSPITQVIQPGQNTVGTAQIMPGAVIPADLSTGGPVWDTSGNVGIGTSSPAAKLNVVGGGTNALIVAGGSGSTIRNTASAGSSWYVGTNVDSYILHNESNTPMLFTTNGTERMRIDASGRVTTPFQPGFRAGLQGSTPSIAAGGIWRFDTDSGNGRFNTGSHYNVSTYTFTAPIAGRYYFHMQIITEGTTNNTSRTDMIVLQLNGGVTAYSERRGYYVANTTGDNGFYVDNVTAILQLSAGDNVRGANNSPSAATQHANGVYSIFEGYLLG